ncbi:unknown [Euproctis pseudoconspersa nucleopolyhedrovirus]|uniref:Uncharacterized protein n=1 Tax=Euproctis pseudoconspersa nucleopolyhedrovirus TaxID=307467 RepID=C3TX04_9ABAC|nr:hypothetical protein EupsNPV_gp096 [Euproctis pseudoconspersa nucleopolyhedrovirus]ACO53546.1 unknown [Euproctis pseudoconspersa nucleopolyhedrovirus]QUJ09286.1 hypothetical protein Gyru_ORF91 [Gynaephora ruoergensis nucleopolyhedrovirus]
MNEIDKPDVATPCVVFVWWHQRQFVYNTYEFPFWHNVQHHALKHRCYVLYYIEDDDVENKQNVENLNNLTMVDFKRTRHAHTVCQINNVACKIDYIKLSLLLDDRLLQNEQMLLVMDMDCVVKNIDSDAIAASKRYVEPFFDKSIRRLYNATGRVDFDSYIENYAMLINRTRPFLNEYQKFSVAVPANANNNFVFSQYLLIVQLYYTIAHNFSFPADVEDLKFVNSINLSFSRGGSWKCGVTKQYSYHYDVKIAPIFGNVCLCTQMRVAILKNDVKKIDQLLERLNELGYNFKSRFGWSNSKQQYVNLAGVLDDKNHNYKNKQYLLPICIFDK